jgi:hypothetical protein
MVNLARGLMWVVGLTAIAGTLPAQESKPAPDTKKAFLLDQAQHYTIQRGQDAAPLALRAEPIFNWTNPERLQHKGTVYVWLAEDRPEVIGSLFTYEVRGMMLEKHAFHSLSQSPLESKFGEALAWNPQKAGLEWKPLAGPAPATTSRQRQTQMRKLARDFTCTLIDPKNGPTELRFLPQPIYEYASPKKGVAEGAIFAFVIATDPEALLLIEAVKDEWRYAFARFHYWELRAKHADRDVWRVEADDQTYNQFGDKAHLTKAYNSYRVGVPKPLEAK